MRLHLLAIGVFLALSGIVSSTSVAADTALKPGGRDAASEALSHLEKSGTKLTYIGNDGGLDAYLGESRTGKMQTFYIAPDGKHLIAGLMFRDDGVNITGVQIGKMRERIDRAAGVPGAMEFSSFLSRHDKTKLIGSLDKTAWFSLGDETRPVVYMVVDPQCPYCHRAWKALEPMIASKKFAVRIIVTSILPGSDEKAKSLLGRANPGEAWLRGEGSSNDVPVSASDDADRGAHALQLNREIVASLGITGTPFMTYVGSDGALYSVDGFPDDLEGFFSKLSR